MEKLNSDDICFIDNYLKNSSVSYFDIRLEMVDHIASAIETRMQAGDKRKFYSVFKDYMIEHKAALLKSYRKFTWKIAKKMMVKALHNLYHPKTLGIALPLVGVAYFFKDSLKQYQSAIGLAFFALMLLMVLLPYLLVKKKYSYMRLSTLVFFFIDYQLIIMLLDGDVSVGKLFWNTAFLIWLNTALLKTMFDLNSRYKKQFSGL